MTESISAQHVQQFRLPDLGEGLEEAQLVQWLVAVGDAIMLNQPICQVETAKALVDIPSPFAGVVQTLHAQPGETVPVGGLLITITGTAEGIAPTQEKADAQEGSGPVLVGYGAGGPAQTFARRRRGANLTPQTPQTPTPESVRGEAISSTNGATVTDSAAAKASPLVRKMAQERGIDLSAAKGTGPGGRIRVEDLEQLPAHSIPTSSPLPVGEGLGVRSDEERISTIGLRKAIAAKMMRSATTIPHFTEYGLFDATNLIALRDRLRTDQRFSGVHLTFLPFFVAGLVTAVKQYPIMNSRWDE
ncbi:MAG TPA: biotin/lipoyl-containing protein, partial [Ktedonobacterales bacterium]|nr:biotin/lipoyl-containing protein [Ktedonobacterales bacterium]